jgi:hypothetical protein
MALTVMLVVLSILVATTLSRWSSSVGSDLNNIVGSIEGSILGDDTNSLPVIRKDKDGYSLYSSSEGEGLSLLATGAFLRDVNGSGWHHLTVTAADLPVAKNRAKQSEASASDALAQAYVDRMRGMGHLEGYLTCREIGEWYINFYSGLFDGGDPTGVYSCTCVYISLDPQSRGVGGQRMR